MTSYIFAFPGQGSQKPGMGAAALSDTYVAETVACASDVFGIDVADVLTQAPAEVLDETIPAQVAVMSLSVGLSRALRSRGVEPTVAIGHSLGQISALAAMDALPLEDAFNLLKQRAQSMSACLEQHPGGMTALLGTEVDVVEQACAELAGDDVLVPANYNGPAQTVVAGSLPALQRIEDRWNNGVGRAVRLRTAGAFHSPLMQQAADEFGAYCESLTFVPTGTPVICNTDAQVFEATQAARRLSDHLVCPVRFTEGFAAAVASCEKPPVVLEVGAGTVLRGLVRRIDRGLTCKGVATVDDVMELAQR